MHLQSTLKNVKWLIVLFVSIVSTLLIVPAPSVTAQSGETTTSDPAPGQENWCLNGERWDDGRCVVPNDPALTRYYFLSGWCGAQVELGNYDGSVEDCVIGVAEPESAPKFSTDGSLNFDLVDESGELACTIVYESDTGKVTSLAQWDDQYHNQSQILFFTDLPGLENFAVSITDYAQEAGTVSATDPNKTLTRAEASIQQRDANGDSSGVIGPVDCELIEE